MEFTWTITPDFYQDEIEWELYTYDGLSLCKTPLGPLNQTVALEKGSYCFSIYDTFGDGGSSGELMLDGTLANLAKPIIHSAIPFVLKSRSEIVRSVKMKTARRVRE